MSLEQLSKTVDFVQDATPSNANDGETYLDTSLSPPRLKVFDSSVGGFVEPRSIQNLDAPVSEAAVDWSSKSAESEIVGSASTVTVSGSGYLIYVGPRVFSADDCQAVVTIDGTQVFDEIVQQVNSDGNVPQNMSMLYRFESSLEVQETAGSADSRLRFNYVLD